MRRLLLTFSLLSLVACSGSANGTDDGGTDAGSGELDAGPGMDAGTMDAGTAMDAGPCPTDTVCDDGDSCTEMDRCDAMGMCVGTPRLCDSPPAAECIGDVLRAYAGGSCMMGDCSSAPLALRCAAGCEVVDGEARCVVPTYEWAEISAGDSHTCARRENGTVMCWGDNDAGQLGTGDRDRRRAPADVMNLDDAVSISAGGSHTCALRATGQVACWGSGGAGQLGDGLQTSSDTLVNASTIDDATAMCAASRYTCAIRADRTVWCWGYEADWTPRIVEPQQMEGIADAVELDCGGQYQCVRRMDGEVLCWGYGPSGALGYDSFGTTRTPMRAGEITDGSALFTGYAQTCVLRPGGLECFGNNDFGQLARGSNEPNDDFNPMGTLFGGVGNGVVTMGGGVSFSCALLMDGSVQCIGRNNTGQLGNRSDSASMAAPVSVYMIDRVRALEVGYRHSCVLVDDQIWCWGSNYDGQLGNGGADTMLAPVQVLLPES